MKSYTWLATVLCISYAAIVHLLPAAVRGLSGAPLPGQKPPRSPGAVFFFLSLLLQASNLCLSLFSWVGAATCFKCLLRNLAQRGFRYTVCTEPSLIDTQVA